MSVKGSEHFSPPHYVATATRKSVIPLNLKLNPHSATILFESNLGGLEVGNGKKWKTNCQSMGSNKQGTASDIDVTYRCINTKKGTEKPCISSTHAE